MIDEKKLEELRGHYTAVQKRDESSGVYVNAMPEIFDTIEKLWRVARAARVYRDMKRPYSTLDARGLDEAIAALDNANAPTP